MVNFLNDFICLFLERGEGREKEREKKINVWLPHTRPLLGTWLTTQACALTGNRTSNPLVHRPVLNPLLHTSQVILIFLLLFSYSCPHIPPLLSPALLTPHLPHSIPSLVVFVHESFIHIPLSHTSQR